LNEALINDGVHPTFSKFAETYIESGTNFDNSYKTAANSSPDREPNMAEPGDILTYTIYAENSGNMNSENALITDLVPDNTSLIDGSITGGLIYDTNSRTLQWSGDIASGIGNLFSFQIIIDEDSGLFQAPNDKVVNEAVISDLTNSFSVENATTIVVDDNGGPNPDNPPYLLEVIPTDKSKSVKLYDPITLKFSEDVDKDSLIYLVTLGERLINTSKWNVTETNGSSTLILQPDKPLESGSTYTIQVIDVVDTNGQNLAIDGPIAENTSSFSTVRPKLYFVDKQILRFEAGTVSNAIEVKLGDWINYEDEGSATPEYAPYTVEGPAGMTVRLWGTSATGRFDVSPSSTFSKAILDVTMLPGTDSLTVYYTDTEVNTPLVYKIVAYPPHIYPLYLVYSDERLVSTNDENGDDNYSQDRIEFTTTNQSIPINFFSNPIEFEIRGSDGSVVPVEAGRTFLLHTSSTTGRFYNSYKLPLDDIIIWENSNYYRITASANSTKMTFYYKDSTPGPYDITVKDEYMSIAAGNGPALDGSQPITVVPIKDQDIPIDEKLLELTDDTGRKLTYITVEPTDTTLLPGKKQMFIAKGFDAESKEIAGLQFGWYVISGGGTIAQPITGSNSATFTAGKTAGVYYDTVMAAAWYNGDLRGGYATVRVAQVIDYGWGNLPSTGPNGIQVILIILMLLSAVALAEVEHYEKTHFPAKKPKFIR